MGFDWEWLATGGLIQELIIVEGKLSLLRLAPYSKFYRPKLSPYHTWFT